MCLRAQQGAIMSIDQDIAQFVAAIGAEALSHYRGSDVYHLFSQTPRKSNYFVFNQRVMMVKISRSAPPFWGVPKKFVDGLEDYYVVLLTSPRTGQVFTKDEVNSQILQKKWQLESKGIDYKIHYSSLPDRNSFSSPEDFVRKVAL
jgi:hypothetical protein